MRSKPYPLRIYKFSNNCKSLKYYTTREGRVSSENSYIIIEGYEEETGASEIDFHHRHLTLLFSLFCLKLRAK